MTAFGICWVIICLFFSNEPVRVLQLILIGSVFEAAAVVNIGDPKSGFPVLPSLIPTAMFIAYLSLKCLLGQHFPAERRVFYTLMPLLLLALYGVVGSQLLPRFLEGAVLVWPQRFDPLVRGAAPLAPSRGNMTQSFYLTIYVGLATVVALYATRRGFPHLALVRTYFASGYLAVFIALWQMVSNMTGIFYPETFLHSNTSWQMFSGQVMGGVNRLNGSFTEPSELALFLCGIIFSCFWVVLLGHQRRSVSILLVLASATNVLSTSTTAMIAPVVGLPTMFIYRFVRGRIPGSGTIGLMAATIVATGLLGSMVLPGVAPRVDRAISGVIHETLTKETSESYETRRRLDRDSVNLAFETYGLGAGWGSVRASSLVPDIMGNAGLVGLVLVSWFILRVRHEAGQARRAASGLDQVFVLDASLGALVGIIAAASVSGSGIALLSFYVLVGLLVGCSTKIRSEARGMQTAAVPVYTRAQPTAVVQPLRPISEHSRDTKL